MKLLILVAAVAVFHSACGQEKGFDVTEELSFFSNCKGKKIDYPQDLIAKGVSALAVCGPQYPGMKFCTGLCVAEQFGYIKTADRTYDWEAASKPLYKMADEKKIDKRIAKIQADALEACGKGQYIQAGDCDEAKEFDTCLRNTQKTACAGTLD